MEDNISHKDTNNIHVIFIFIAILIAAGAVMSLNDPGCAIICWVLYFIYYAIHIEIQDNHNKLIDFMNKRIEHDNNE